MTVSVLQRAGFGRSRPSERATRALLGIAVVATLLGSALGFAVQPLVSRQLLPRLGGSAAVWNTTLVFFQAVLLLGYLMTHLTSKLLRPGAQAAVHLGVLVAGLVVLPVGVPKSWVPPTAGTPVWWQLWALTVTVGPVYLAVATASPLIQRWLSLSTHHRGRDPYVLYAISNVGSFIGLLILPVWLDRSFSLNGQSRLWAIFYCAFLACCVALVAITRPGTAPDTGIATDTDFDTDTDTDTDTEAVNVQPVPASPRPLQLLRWTALAFVPSSLILGVTTHITTDVASVPLLWVIPLGLYLLTHIIAFSEHAPPRRIRDVLAAVAVATAIATTFVDYLVFPWTLAPHFAALFFVGLACHGRLADDRPAPVHLTTFYLALAVGGLAGGLFNAIVAPQVFDMVIEYPMMLVAGLLFLGAGMRGHSRIAPRRLPLRAVITITLAAGIIAWTIMVARDIEPHPGRVVMVMTLVAGAATALGRSLVAAGLVGTIAVIAVQDLGAVAVRTERGFYGAIRVEEANGFRNIVHGTTMHGYQFMDPQRRSTITGYYAPPGPLSDVVYQLRSDDGQLGRVGVLGLGVGTIAGYLDTGDEATFYEIDPIIVRLARDRDLFSYVSDAPAPVRIVVGDGRRALADSDDRYDLLVIDAFSSDAIPVHLLTVEAVRTYMEHLDDDGILAIHVSNRYLQLKPVVGAIAEELGVSSRAGSFAETPEQSAAGILGSDWVVLAKDPALVNRLPNSTWVTTPIRDDVRAWTDDRADLLGVLVR